MSYTKIQVIKMLRDQIPGIGLKEAKDIVDSYEVKTFEDRVARAMGEEARIELRNWARLFVAGENRTSLPWRLSDPETNVLPEQDKFYDDYVGCSCDDCMDAR